jgi:peptidoglycan/LPS O-acetylase OafA/YrhL
MLGSFFYQLECFQQSCVSASFLTQARIWEILAGCCLAQLEFLRPPNEQSLGRSMTYFRDARSILGFILLVPVVGAPLVLSAGSEAIINKSILSWKPLVFIELIS